MPYFSIIIPVYNKEKFVLKTIESVLKQTFTDYEIIVVNDGSTDDSESVIKTIQDDRIHYFSKANEGVAVARNIGIEKAKSDFICFLDADDFWHPNFLETFHLYSQKLPEQKVFSVAIEIETGKKTFAAQYSLDRKNDYEIVDFFEASQQECVLWTSGTVIHKSVLQHIGNFDVNIKKGEDTELWIRIGLHYPIVFIWEILARYVYDQHSASRNLTYFFEPYTFQKYAVLEKQNPKLKQYMDLNRFSAVIKCKLSGDFQKAKALYNDIDLNNLSKKKAVLLQLPNLLLKILIGLKNFWAKNGLGNAVFR